MQYYRLGLRVGLKDLPTLRTRIHRQILTGLKTFLFYHSTFLTGRTYASRARLRDCISWRSVALHFAKLCLPKPLPLLLGTGRTPRPQTRLRVPTQSAHPPMYPHRRPTTLIWCPPKDLRSHGREKLGRRRKSSCRRRRTRRMRRLPRNIGGLTRMVCGCKQFDLVAHFTSFSCKMRAFPILPPSYLFVVLQKRMRSPLMGPNRGISIGMTALANNNATNINTQRKEKKKEKKCKKEDPWKKPKTHTRNGKRRLRLSTWLTLLALQVQVQVQLHRARQRTPNNHEPRRNVVCTATHHCTMVHVTWFRSFNVNPCLQQQWSRGRRTGRRDAVRQSHAARVHPRRQVSEVSPWWRHLFACPFCVNCAFFLVCPFFLPHIVHLLVGLFRDKGCGGAHSEDEGAPGSQGP